MLLTHESPVPSARHDTLLELLRSRPELLRTLLPELLPQPGLHFAPLDPVLGEVAPVEYRADLVWRVSGGLELVLVIEIQLRPDPRKRHVWPLYATLLHARHKRPVVLIVLTPSQAVASWAAQPLAVGPDFVLRPLVLGPGQIPAVTDHDLARDLPELGVMSAIVHGRGPLAYQVGAAALEGLALLDTDATRLYFDLVLSALRPQARALLETEMLQDWKPRSAFLRNLIAQGRAQGRSEGLVRGREEGLARGREEGLVRGREEGLVRSEEVARALLLRLLVRRFGPLPERARARIERAKLPQLEAWAEHLLDAPTLPALLRVRPAR